MLPCCPTDGQAEILIKHDIPLRFIRAIIVGNESAADQINAVLKICKCKIDIYIAPDVCNTNWSIAGKYFMMNTDWKYERY